MTPVVLALGSNLGDRRYHLNAALFALRQALSICRVSSVIETDPVDCPPGSSPFLNLVVAGFTSLPAEELLRELHQIEARQGRRRGVRNAPRPIDIDIILFGAHLHRSKELTLPHPRYRERAFVMAPLRELQLPWCDPVTMNPLR